MPVFALTWKAVPAEAQLALMVLLGAVGFYFLLPRPRGRVVALGVFSCLAALAVGFGFVLTQFGQPSSKVIEQVLFWLFSTGALVSGGILVSQRNPARGAMAFALVILSSCGLFLLLAAPFLMAATLIIYTGAIVVTFLFVLMLSNASGPSDENDRTREPLLGSLGGFAFLGLVLFSLYLSSPAGASTIDRKPAVSAPISDEDFRQLTLAINNLSVMMDAKDSNELPELVKATRDQLASVVGYAPGEALPSTTKPQSVQDRLARSATDARVFAIIAQAQKLRDNKKLTLDKIENVILERGDVKAVQKDLAALREEVILLSGRGLLPARNVAAIGMTLYSEHLIAVEMAGTLLLIATIGAVAIANRKGVPA